MKITLICGSASENSGTLALLKNIKRQLDQSGIETIIWNLRENPLPMLMPQFHKNPGEAEDETVKQFIKTIANSDGIVLGTPLYQGSFSGLLKSALDWLVKDGFNNKAVGLVGNCGSRNPIALEHLRSVVRTLYGYALQTQIATQTSDFETVDGELKLVDETIQKRVDRFTDELINLTTMLKDRIV